MEHSWKTQKYIEALIRDGEAFNRQEWLKEVNATTSEVEKCRAPTPMGAHPVPRPAVDMKEEPRQALLQSMPVGRRQTKETGPARRSIDQEIDRMCDAWDDLQENRKRDAVYKFLGVLFLAVKRSRIRGKLNRLLRRAQGLVDQGDGGSREPYAILIRAASNGRLDRRMISRYAMVLRAAEQRKKRGELLKNFVKRCGGLNACASRYRDRNRKSHRAR